MADVVVRAPPGDNLNCCIQYSTHAVLDLLKELCSRTFIWFINKTNQRQMFDLQVAPQNCYFYLHLSTTLIPLIDCRLEVGGGSMWLLSVWHHTSPPSSCPRHRADVSAPHHTWHDISCPVAMAAAVQLDSCNHQAPRTRGVTDGVILHHRLCCHCNNKRSWRRQWLTAPWSTTVVHQSAPGPLVVHTYTDRCSV